MTLRESSLALRAIVFRIFFRAIVKRLEESVMKYLEALEYEKVPPISELATGSIEGNST